MAFSFGATPSSTTPAAGTSGFTFGGQNPSSSTTGLGGFNFGGSSAAPTSNTNAFSFASSQPSMGSGFSLSTSAPTTSTSSTFSFGANATGTAAPTNNTGFSFNSTSTSSSFGSFPATTTATNSGFGGFGPASTTTATPFGGFGATSKPMASTGFGGFGTTSAAPTTGFGGFGTTSATPTTGFGGFGSTFGTSADSKPPSSFGTANTTSMIGFGNQQANFNTQPNCTPSDSPLESLNAVKMAYQDPQHSRFKHMFYNIVDPSQRALYVKPPHISERLWKQAEADNPDSSNCVPAAVVGFKELEERVKTQQEYTTKLVRFVEELRNTLKSMGKSCRATDAHLEKCRHEHILLSHKLIEVMRKIEVYQCLHLPLHAEEIKLRNDLQKLQSLINQPTMFKARLHELVSLERTQEERNLSGLDQLSETDVEAVYEILKKQSIGLQHLTKIVKRDIRDFEIMKRGVMQNSVGSETAIRF